MNFNILHESDDSQKSTESLHEASNALHKACSAALRKAIIEKQFSQLHSYVNPILATATYDELKELYYRPKLSRTLSTFVSDELRYRDRMIGY